MALFSSSVPVSQHKGDQDAKFIINLYYLHLCFSHCHVSLLGELLIFCVSAGGVYTVCNVRTIGVQDINLARSKHWKDLCVCTYVCVCVLWMVLYKLMSHIRCYLHNFLALYTTAKQSAGVAVAMSTQTERSS